MSKVHALEANGEGIVRLVVHQVTPTGNNSVGVSWVAAGLASGDLGHSVLPVGTGPGQISQAEADAIKAGTTAEIETTVPIVSGGTAAAQQQAVLDAAAAAALRDWQARLATRLRYYGYTR